MPDTHHSDVSRASQETDDSLRLKIDPVIETAEDIAAHVAQALPMHPGLGKASRGVAQAAVQAKRVSGRLKRPLGIHRLPAVFLVASLTLLAIGVYFRFLHTPRLVVALSARDAVQLKKKLGRQVRVVTVETVGSRESIEQLQNGQVDVAFVQGGVEFPNHLPHMELGQSEWVLFFLREGIDNPARIRKVFTSSEGQGSHSLAQIFTRIWGVQDSVVYVHDWREFTDDPEYRFADDIDAVFVVKDPMSPKIEGVAARLKDAGFRLASPDIGAMNLRLDYLQETEFRPGYLDAVAKIPPDKLKTYSVAGYLVARADLSSRQLAAASHLIDSNRRFPNIFEPTLNTANDFVQGVEAVLGIGVYIGLAFLALLGLDIVAYRRCFHELNSLVSLISMHQSSKDVLGGDDEQRARHVAYLSVCSDLLGLIAVITGYYAQENSSLMYNRLLGIINDRCSALKINIQLKILHATIELPNRESSNETAIEPKQDDEQVDP